MGPFPLRRSFASVLGESPRTFAALSAVNVIGLLVVIGRSPRISRKARGCTATSKTGVAHTLLRATRGAIPVPKIENPHLIEIELCGKRAKNSQSEYELSPDEWHRRRRKAFAQLRQGGFIPGELLDLVEHFKEQTRVQPFVYRPTEKVEFRFGVKVAGGQEKADKARRLADIMAAHKRMQDDDEKEGMTASEALAFLLRIFLRELKHAEKNRKAAPVRTLNLVPRSLIAEIAMDLLGSCETWGHPPGPFLNSLIRELLNLEHDKQGMSRYVETQERAAGIVTQAPAVRTREPASMLYVNASTISRWRRSPEFKQMVERKKESLKTRAGLSKSIGPSEQGKLTQEEIAQLLLAISLLSP